MTTFRHEPLDHTKKQIRLLKLLPATGQTVVCSIEHVDLEEQPRYHALSYTWGEPELSHTVLCNGRPYKVRRNLFTFLGLMGKEAFDGYLWVDQICIDQDHVLEKNHQVLMMADIYRKASEVIVWLGPANVRTLT